jgi:biopolymer transport protein ExbD
MKFPRNARMLRSQLDVAPFASVFFLLVIFVMLGSLVYTPGVRIQLPVADDLPGTDKPTIRVAMDASGRLYFRSQQIEERELTNRFREAVAVAAEPLTLVILADKAVTHGDLIHLGLIARDAGITNGLLATLPRLIAAPNGHAPSQP